ncbi:MAG: HNH endonuclease signature motif containing protein [Bacteroidota bacterium]
MLDAVQQSGGSGVYLSDSVRAHPRKFGVQYLDQSFTLWVYIWTLTHGGRASLPGEYRIQMTTVNSPLALNLSGYTVLVGYEPSLGIFGGFDIAQHQTFTPGSSSVQIDLSALQAALQNGLDFTTKDNQEVAIGIRPDQFLEYVLNALLLHTGSAEVLPLVQRAAASEDVEAEANTLPPERKRVVTEVSRLSRAANFRRKVLDAYGHRCAVTRAQLRLVDAAHILPVAVEGSTDVTTNGITLSPTMHRAFDHGLIFLDPDRFVRLNNEKADRLRTLGLSDGLADLTASLDSRIHLPADQDLWPSITIIERANTYRRIPGYS